MAMQTPVVRRGMRMPLELEAGALRRVQREGKIQTVQVRWQAEESQRLKWGRMLPQAGFG